MDHALLWAVKDDPFTYTWGDIMPDGGERLLSVEEFSHETLCSQVEIIRNLEAGRISGTKVQNEWYILSTQVDTALKYCRSETDALMRAAAALDWFSILQAIDARRKAVFRAPTVELGLSIAQIRAEAERARRRAFSFDLLIGMAGLFGVIAGMIVLNRLFGADAELLAEEDNSSAAAIVLCAYAVIVCADWTRLRMAKQRAREILGTHAAERAYDTADCARDQPNVVVSGGYNPFVGAGHRVGGWSFTMNLAQPEDPNTPVQQATAKALYEEAESALHVLGMPNFIVRDEIYVDGRDVRDIPQLMPHDPFQRPIDTLSARDMEQQIGKSDDRIRHYKAIRSVLWDSQIVLSTFLRYVVVKNVLFVEARMFALPPLMQKFLDLKNLPLVPQFSERAKDFTASLMRATFIWIAALANIVSSIANALGDSKRQWLNNSKNEVLANQRYNYGWARSLREYWAGDDFERYFQLVDLDFHKKIIQESLLDSLMKSLRQRNVCTESLQAASTTIHNEGVIVNGGSVQAQNISAGKSAQATSK